MSRTTLAVGVGVSMFVVAVPGLGLTYNTTASLPLGIYQIRPLEREPQVGDIVGVCLDSATARMALARGYVHPAGLQRVIFGIRCAAGSAVIGKPVAAVPGDTVDVLEGEIWVNGTRLQRSWTSATDRAGRSLPRPTPGRIILGEGEFWLHSRYSERSFDSRYFGPVRRSDVRDRRLPIWTRSSSEG